jgi:phosphoribosyl 1,2-cyclic phosphodiesterase
LGLPSGLATRYDREQERLVGQRSTALRLRGVRGSIPTASAARGAYGGNTCCLELAVDERHVLLVDCGSGLRSVEQELPPAGGEGLRFDVLLTHYHWDHVIGLPFFGPLYDAASTFTFYGPGYDGAGVGSVLERLIAPPSFPVALADTPSRKRYVDLGTRPLEIGDLEVATARLNHPQGAVAFRLARAGRSVVLATDHERGVGEIDAGLCALAAGADVLIHDAQYTPEEYEHGRRGWGHSSWEHAAVAADEAAVRRLLLFHHDPDRSDDELEAIVTRTASLFAEVEAAREGDGLEI